MSLTVSNLLLASIPLRVRPKVLGSTQEACVSWPVSLPYRAALAHQVTLQAPIRPPHRTHANLSLPLSQGSTVCVSVVPTMRNFYTRGACVLM